MSSLVQRRFGLAASMLITAAMGLAPVGAAHAGAQPAPLAQTRLATGSIAGYLTEGGTPKSASAGSPVPNSRVVLYDLDFNEADETFTDEGGLFTFPAVPSGTYKISFELPGIVTQFLHQSLDFDSADLVTVVDGQETTLHEEVVPHGSIAGQVTTSTGDPSPNPYVLVYRPGGDLLAQINGDDQGNYLIPYVPIGPVQLELFPGGDSGRRQWIHEQRAQELADVFAITDGGRTTINERLLGTGVIRGHFTDANGDPAPGVPVTARDVVSGVTAGGYTDDQGAYTIDVLPGTYKIEFELPGGLVQWAHGKTSDQEGDPVTVAVGDEVVVDDRAIPTGTVAGHLTDAAGRPVANANVELTDDHDTFLNANTAEDGSYSITAFPGTYKVYFSTETQAQWARGKTTSATADPIVVAGGQTTVVDDALLRTGHIQVTATDATTGAPISTFCSAVNNGPYVQACTTTGVATMEAGPGRYQLITYIPDDLDYLSARTDGVMTISDQTTSVAVQLVRGATVRATVRDAKTGTPVASACLELMRTDNPVGLGSRRRGCTDAHGRLTVRQLEPGLYNPFVWANDGVHGHQWVGPNGGVGAQAKARVLTATSGGTTNLTVRLDRAGSITGVIKDRATGKPLQQAIVGLSSFNDGFGPTRAQVFTDAQGRYTIENLGPYAWPLFLDAAGHPGQWSGGGTNRLTAEAVKVKAGKATTFNAELRQGSTLAGRVTGPDGAPLPVRVTVINAITHDEMGSGDTEPDGSYRIPVLGEQPVKLGWSAFTIEFNPNGYYRNATDLAHAKTVVIPAHGNTAVNIKIASLG